MKKIRLLVDIFVFGAIIVLIIMLTNKLQIASKQIQENRQENQENRQILIQNQNIIKEVLEEVKGD